MCIYIYEADKITYYAQWTWPKWVVPIGCEDFRTNLNIPCPLPTTLVFGQFCRLLIFIYIIYIYTCITVNFCC